MTDFKFLLPFLLLFSTQTYSQTDEMTDAFNWGFEKEENGLPLGWLIYGSDGYHVSLDSKVKHSGDYSVSIAHDNSNSITNRDLRILGYYLPKNYKGKKITLSGYIKTENITDGYASLWIRIIPSIGYINMEDMGLKGSTNWEKFEISLDMIPLLTQNILVGGYLAGNGKMWMDDLSVSIDGNDISDSQLIEFDISKHRFGAENDQEFDLNSKINKIPTDRRTIKKLKSLGLIWGFLKYHHPAVATGDINWDYELFRVLPIVIEAKDKDQLDTIFINWIHQLGDFEDKKLDEIVKSKIQLYPDLSFIDNSEFSNELIELLIKVKNAERINYNYYVNLTTESKKPTFSNEKPYPDNKYPDTGYRVLALFRYWNIIQYYFPNRNLIEDNWVDVLESFIPRFINSKNVSEYTLTTLELITNVHDGHAQIFSNDVVSQLNGTLFSAAIVNFIEGKAIITSFHDDDLGKKSGLQIGDEIYKVNNNSVKKIIKESANTMPASNEAAMLRDIAYYLLANNEPTINVKYLRNDKRKSHDLTTYPRNIFKNGNKKTSSLDSIKLITNNIAYINHRRLHSDDLSELWKIFKNTKGLIIDIRDYPSNFPLYELNKYLLPETKPFIKYTVGSYSQPGMFTYTRNDVTGQKNENYYKGKIIILINEETQSKAEYHVMGYQVTPNSITLGSTTAGTDGNVSMFQLPGGIATAFTGLGIFYPDNKATQRVGIIPDIVVKPTIKGIKEGKDEVLDKAIEILSKL